MELLPNLDTFMNLCIHTDDHLTKCCLERESSSRLPSTFSSQGPRQISWLWRHLPDTVMGWCHASGLCLYCGESGHCAVGCQLRTGTSDNFMDLDFALGSQHSNSAQEHLYFGGVYQWIPLILQPDYSSNGTLDCYHAPESLECPIVWSDPDI